MSNTMLVKQQKCNYQLFLIFFLISLGMKLPHDAGYFFARIFFASHWPPGFTTITVLILLSISLNALFLGVIGEYLGRIYKQTKTQSSVVIESSIND